MICKERNRKIIKKRREKFSCWKDFINLSKSRETITAFQDNENFFVGPYQISNIKYILLIL